MLELIIAIAVIALLVTVLELIGVEVLDWLFKIVGLSGKGDVTVRGLSKGKPSGLPTCHTLMYIDTPAHECLNVYLERWRCERHREESISKDCQWACHHFRVV